MELYRRLLRYMKQPEGYEVMGKKDWILKLKKSTYGLKQSANVWNRCLTEKLMTLQYVQSKADPFLHVKVKMKTKNYITIYVDDIVLVTNDQEEIETVETVLSKHFEITKLGQIKNYSGIQIERNRDGVFYIHQKKHIKEILETYNLKDAKGSNIPLDPGYEKLEDESQLMKNKEYQSLIGSLMYIAVSTRPDNDQRWTIIETYSGI